MMRLLSTFLFFSTAALAASESRDVATFYRDAAPILQKHCQECHRPGEIAPMSLLGYEEARPWAQAIKESVSLKRMPPWFADPHAGLPLKNDRSLTPAEIETLVRWVDSGAPAGDPADAPPPVEFTAGWNIGEPEMVFEMSREFDVPAAGEVDYQYHVIPSGFTEDRWVRAAEIRPGNRAVVHHVIVFVRPPGSQYIGEAKVGEFFVPRKREEGERGPKNQKREFLIGYAPGSAPEVLEPGQAKLIPAGSDFVLQLHYTPNGDAQADRSRFGLVFADETPRERVVTAAVQNDEFVIPPGAADHRVEAEMKIKDELTITAFLPHMHLRGKSFEYRAVYPDGREQVLLRVPRYDFNWQLSYYLAEPVTLPAGAELQATAIFDNSPNNPANPDPTAEVRYGDQSWEEMMIGFFNMTFPAKEKKGESASE